MVKCDFCNKQSAHSYRGHDVCELHYLKLNPERNASIVLLTMRDRPPWKIKDRMELLTELKKCLPLKEIDDCLKDMSWYQRLKTH